MISRMRALATGVAALAALLAAVVGLPVVLYQFGGSPLPGDFSGWHHIGAILGSRDDGTLLLTVIRELSWLAWLLFTIAVLAEAQAMLRGRSAPRLWIGGMQGGAARLVALAALTFAAPSAVSLTASAATAAPAHQGPVSAANGHKPNGRKLNGHELAAEQAARLVTVRSGDCLWSIARHYLGAGDRYLEIASMNLGHDMGDGQVFTNPSVIQPGWRLALPDSAAPDSPAASDGPAHHLGHATRDAHYRRWHPAAPPHQAAPLHQAAPSHPAGAAASAAAGADANAGGASPGAAGQSADQGGYQTSADVAGPAGDELPAAALFAAGALAGAVLTNLTRLRRRQRQYRRRGRRIALPADPEVLAAEQRLRAAAPSQPPSTLRDALRCLESGIVAAGQVLPDIVGLHVTPGALEVLLAAPALDSPPAPYVITPGRQGMCWELALPATAGPTTAGPLTAGPPPAGPPTAWSAADGARAADGSGLLPGLFTAGSTDAGYLLLDLESMQVTGCDGPPGLVDEVVTAAATELATGQWSGWYDLVLVGFPELEVLGRAEHCGHLDDALDLLAGRCAAVGRRLADDPPADVRQLRLTAPQDEDWGLTIMVSRVQPTPDQMTQLLELAEDGPGGIAALIAGDPETADGRMAPAVMQLAPDPAQAGEIVANVIPLQIMVRPQTLSTAEYEAISTLFAVAGDLTDVGPEQVPYEVYAAPPWLPQADLDLGPTADLDPGPQPGPSWHDAAEFTALTSRTADITPADGVAAPPWVTPAGPGQSQDTQRHLEVKILGPFVITGALEQLQPKQAELVLALALAAPGGLSNSALCSMLGTDPDHPKPSDAVRQVITRTRRRLGRASDGQEYIIHSGSGNYLLHPDAALDWTQFRTLVASSRAEEMRAALSMVRGEPFTGSFYWWIDIPLLETVRAEITDAAQMLGEFELAAGSPRAAARAALAGLSAETSAEQLWRLLMRAEHAAGNAGGVAEAWRHCLDAIEDIAPGGEPHPDTVALYHQLTARQHAPVRG